MNMDIYKLEKPDFKKINESEVFAKIDDSSVFDRVKKFSEERYLYWDDAKYKNHPEGLTNLEFWYLVKQIRKLMSSPTYLISESGRKFFWVRLGYTDEFLHKIDMYTGGQVFTLKDSISLENKQKFMSRGILEEAIASSQLEGANTTRQAAKKMILENRPPRNKSEKMIVNNYITMKALEDEYKNKELSLEMLFELHQMLVKDTVPSEEQGRLRTDKDNIVVSNSEVVTHVPPKEKFLKSEMNRLITYANDQEGEKFLHPVIKAIFIHFWIGYLHPFTDGNGRLARTLFYWYLLKNNYWTFMYLPISSIIKNSPSQYSKAFIYTEQDDLDLTYFYDYHIRKIMKSIENFNEYIDKIVKENRKIDELLGRSYSLNDRQKQLLHYLLAEGESAYATVLSHRTLNNIGRITAARDLKDLEKKNLLIAKKVGKFVNYYSSQMLQDKLFNS